MTLEHLGIYSALGCDHPSASHNPHLQTTSSSSNEEIHVKAINLEDPLVYGGTSHTRNGEHITHATIELNTVIV